MTTPFVFLPRLFLDLPLSAVLVKPVEVCGNFVFGGLCKKRKKTFVESTIYFRCFLFVFVKPRLLFRFFCFCFSNLLSFSLCYCFLLLCSLIQTSLSCCPFSQRWKDSLTSSKVYGAMFFATKEFWESQFPALAYNSIE